MKETLLLLVLASLSSRLAAAAKVEDPTVASFARKLAYAESAIALRRLI